MALAWEGSGGVVGSIFIKSLAFFAKESTNKRLHEWAWLGCMSGHGCPTATWNTGSSMYPNWSGGECNLPMTSVRSVM